MSDFLIGNVIGFIEGLVLVGVVYYFFEVKVKAAVATAVAAAPAKTTPTTPAA